MAIGSPTELDVHYMPGTKASAVGLPKPMITGVIAPVERLTVPTMPGTGESPGASVYTVPGLKVALTQ